MLKGLAAKLYHLMQQRESDTSRGLASDSKKIAEASKRDSSSMKAIAALTMFFLPGAGVAVGRLPTYSVPGTAYADEDAGF